LIHGNKIEMKVQKWFDFPVPKPTVSESFIDSCIEEYEQLNKKHAASLNAENAKNLWWLGGTPVRCGTPNSNNHNNQDNFEYRWLYLMEEQSAPAKFVDVELLLSLRPEVTEDIRTAALNKIAAAPEVLSNLKKLLGRGLVLLDF